MLRKQAKTLSDGQIRIALIYLRGTRNPSRNRLIFLLSYRAGLRAKEIACLRWSMVTDAIGNISRTIRLEDSSSKGRSGGVIPMADDLREAMMEWASSSTPPNQKDHVICTERSKATSPQVIVNLFREWYKILGFEGCSSHSGRRTFITKCARNIGKFGGSLRDVQVLARHSSLAMTQSYIEIDSDAMMRVVNIKFERL